MALNLGAGRLPYWACYTPHLHGSRASMLCCANGPSPKVQQGRRPPCPWSALEPTAPRCTWTSTSPCCPKIGMSSSAQSSFHRLTLSCKETSTNVGRSYNVPIGPVDNQAKLHRVWFGVDLWPGREYRCDVTFKLQAQTDSLRSESDHVHRAKMTNACARAVPGGKLRSGPSRVRPRGQQKKPHTWTGGRAETQKTRIHGCAGGGHR